MQPLVSICVATYRRPDRLLRLLKSLQGALQQIDCGAEVIIVDNDKNESAKSAMKDAQKLIDNIYYYHEPEQNIALARNRALKHVKGSWIAFVDDDEVVEQDWLKAYCDYAENHTVDGLFGPVIPKTEQSPPAWFDAELMFSRPRFSTGTQLQKKMRTGNAFIHQSVFVERQFDPNLGLTGGSDAEFFEAMAKNGKNFFWLDSAITYELYPRDRITLKWMMQRYFRSGLQFSKSRLKERAYFYRLLLFLKSTTLIAVFALYAGMYYMISKPKSTFYLLRSCVQVGHLAAIFNVNYYEYKA